MGEIQLEWKNHDKDLSTKLWEFFKEEYLVDFSVTCHGQQMKVHKFILALLFPMLKESFKSTSNLPLDRELVTVVRDDKVGISTSSMLPTPLCLNLDNISDHSEDMNYLIQFAYTGKATVPKEHADCLMRIADIMEIKSLKDSLGHLQANSELADKAKQNDITSLNRLRPRKQLKKVADKSMYITDSDDTNYELDEESKSDSVESSDSCSNTDARRIKRSRKKMVPTKTSIPKSCSGGDCSKETIEYVRTLNMTETQEKQKKTDSEEEVNGKAPSNEQTKRTDIEVKGKKNLKCPQCDYVAKYPDRFKCHLESHAKEQTNNPRQFSCKLCRKRFETRMVLEIHRDSNCGREPLACKYCGHKTRHKLILLQHMMAKHKVDADGNPLEKNVKCPDCDFVCYAKHQLQYHSRAKHKRQNKFKCKKCNYTASYVSHLRQHDRIVHQNVRDYMCEECGKRFQSAKDLNRHFLVQHKGVKPHKCHICSAEYSDSLAYKIHMQRHEGKVEYKFVCHICGHNLRRKYELKRHVKNKHGIEMEEELAMADDFIPCQLGNAGKTTS